MKIEAVDFFYLAMPEVTTAADGSQDALLVRVRGGGLEGWGECEASPLTSIAAFVCPMSHGVCRPVGDSVLGQKLDDVADIHRIAALVERDSMDLLQAAHTFSGVEMALWDLLGKLKGEPVWRLLGYRSSEPKVPYASMLFGDTPDETRDRARQVLERGFQAAKFGWAGYGAGSRNTDADHVRAAREGLGPDALLMVDAGQIWGNDLEAAASRLPDLEAAGATWLEEPFHASAYDAYSALSARSSRVRLAGGEGAHNVYMARHLIDYGGVGFVQIDCGRIGGILPAKQVADYAVARDVKYVNHTFTSHLALSASLQPYAGLSDHRICEYPAEPKSLAVEITREHLLPDANGQIKAPDSPGLGLSVNAIGLTKYLVDTEIKVGGRTIYATPSFT
ncbi:mandelate racemase/muconate lactonizing enzyme family protein [Tianweitania sediminis]|uniref:Mandelate racemase/muconate lactonizing enzyme family protein n=1 Tax=Tianweitania sediminis TaxID=1502156 RepID=A0A8J7QX52_9HYPH|nr:mandelate racemase/muconate lactonizing enzyme family protein [Tianweitania sediminis]MBP0438368.1 mandelate racemase/muconate lactonizing enzyme family protein [Tianweitania sediminis]